MLLLPTTLSTLSVALGAALLPVPGLEDAAGQLPAAALVADIAYVQEVRAEDAGEHLDPGLPYLSDVIAGEDENAQFAAIEPPPSDTGAMADDNGFGPAADPASLDQMRGGDGSSSSSIVMNGTVADNRATNVVTGTNMITEGSFANASGVPMVVQNTGANVLIQNATVINLQLR
jgi:hypothetical protein